MSNQSKLRILSIAHPAVSRDIGRLRYHPFAEMKGLDVHLLAPARWVEYGRRMRADPADDPGVTMHIEPVLLDHLPGVKWYGHFYPRLHSIIGSVKPDVIHLWEEPWSVVALQAALLRKDAALVLEVDQNILKRLPPPFEAIRRHVLKKTDLILSRSPEANDVVRARGFTGPIRPIGYGVDSTAFFPKARPREPRPVNSPLRLGYVGRLNWEKGIDDTLTALTLARSPVTFALMGEGPYAEQLRQRVQDLRLHNRVSVRGWGNPKDVAAFLQSVDVSVLFTHSTPAWREQFGRTIIESQSCGIPVIGSSSGAIPSVVGHGGWIVPEGDTRALADLVDHLYAAPEEIAARATAGLANVAARFTYQRVAEALDSAWREADSRKRRSRQAPRLSQSADAVRIIGE